MYKRQVGSGVDGDTDIFTWTPPYSGAWRFRQRVFDDELRASEWVESGPYLYVKEVDGTTVFYYPTPPGRCAPLSLGKQGDINVPPAGGFVERRSTPLLETREYTDGIICRLPNVEFLFDSTDQKWKAQNLEHLLSRDSQKYPPAYITELWIAKEYNSFNRIGISLSLIHI